MAYYSIFPESDTTLYSHPDRSQMNAGSDEILEIIKERGTTDTKLYPSRILIKFKTEDMLIAYNIATSNHTRTISEINSDTNRPPLYTASLELFAATSQGPTNFQGTQNIELYALSQSFNEGTGRYDNLPTSSNGATWEFRDDSVLKTSWATTFNDVSTGSLVSASILTAGGGAWYDSNGSLSDGFTGFTQQIRQGDSLDVNLNISPLINKFINGQQIPEHPGGIENNGMLLKLPDTIENNTTSSLGNLQYFSVDTHTIYTPKLTFKFDDSIHESQSLAKQNGELSVSLYQNHAEYNNSDEVLFRIHVRDKYPIRQFASSSNYLNPGYFTTSSFYSIRDAYTEQEIIPFDEANTKLSADEEGMFFKMYMKGLQPERFYRVLFKHKNNEGVKVYDNNYFFKVIR
tara:strand:- start:11966 stop:13174 length:1209 start_codon:yes stop_codon:yes gene_type:complete